MKPCVEVPSKENETALLKMKTTLLQYRLTTVDPVYTLSFHVHQREKLLHSAPKGMRFKCKLIIVNFNA